MNESISLTNVVVSNPVQSGTWSSMEKPSIRSRGVATPDPFGTQVSFISIEPQKPITNQQLLEMKFHKTLGGVFYRQKEAQGNMVGVEVKDRNIIINLKTTSEYLGQGFRSAGIELRAMQNDLAALKRMVAKQEFEETSYFA